MSHPLPYEQLAAFRILDANLNRATEGLRVVEEYARFVLDDTSLTQLLKTLRHELINASQLLDAKLLLASRNIADDVGTEISTAGEYERTSLRHVVEANLRRVQQALRALEEYGKIIRPEFAQAIEAIRYRVYDAHVRLVQRKSSVAAVSLQVLIDGGQSADAFVQSAESLVAAGVEILQLRDKSLDDRTLLDRARLLRKLTHGTATRFIMNDRPDLAVLSQADGIHVGQDDLGISEIRKIVGSDMLIGVSTHTIEQAHRAVAAGADYLGCGPTFPSSTKSFESFPGLPFLQQVAMEIPLPAFAIGGISLDNLDDVLATGCTRIAVSGSVTRAAVPGEAVRKLLTRLHASEPARNQL